MGKIKIFYPRVNLQISLSGVQEIGLCSSVIDHMGSSRYQNVLSIKLNIFFPTTFNISFGCSKELSHRDSSFEYPQHMFGLKNKK